MDKSARSKKPHWRHSYGGHGGMPDYNIWCRMTIEQCWAWVDKHPTGPALEFPLSEYPVDLKRRAE